MKNYPQLIYRLMHRQLWISLVGFRQPESRILPLNYPQKMWISLWISELAN
ncbi:hypothetical protein [Alysiella crassa]|uniref:hypothetical protein n=1 Tax=Alysiella crassa TaxID=153491 RepID=UPI001FD35427|nr:hypothetical protein [Alysiella crassa]UOP07256.1 hypothetical protein LVJ80_02065 [Alysiella crassa]